MTHTKQKTEQAGSKAYPAPSALSVPTNISSEGAQQISQAVNGLVADAFALYLKTKNFHWHLSGSHFRDYHLLFAQQAEQIFATIDPLAERVRKLGGTTLRSVSDVASKQHVQDNNAEFVTPLEMLQELMEDNKNYAGRETQTHELCEKYKDVATASLLEVYIDETQRRTWFLFEAAQGEAHTG